MVSRFRIHDTVLYRPRESRVPLLVVRQDFLIDRFFKAERCDMEYPRAMDLDERDGTSNSSLLPQSMALLQH